MKENNQSFVVEKNVHYLSNTTWLLLWTTLAVVLKLTGSIDWHWIWVFAPLWGLLAAVFLTGFISGLKQVHEKRRRNEMIARALGKRRN